MTPLLTPPRRRGIEILDDPGVDPHVMTRSMRDVERANSIFGGRRAALAELRYALEELGWAAGAGATALLVDVGTGCGDISRAARSEAARAGLRLWTAGVDLSLPLLCEHRDASDAVLRADACFLPFRTKSVDIVIASQLLHHFEGRPALDLVRELNRVARNRVVISDLRRSIVAVAGLWLGSFVLRFHPVSRHDGVVSVMRGFLPGELQDLVHAAVGVRPPVNRRLGFRVTTSWVPAS